MINENNSNLAYIVAGLFILQSNVTIGILTIALGVSSWYSHSSRNWLPDWVAMWFLFYALIGYWTGWMLPMIILAAITVIFEREICKLDYLFKLPPEYIVLGAIYLIGVACSFIFGNVILASISLITFAIAFYIRQKGHHSIWHILTATGLLILFL